MDSRNRFHWFARQSSGNRAFCKMALGAVQGFCVIIPYKTMAIPNFGLLFTPSYAVRTEESRFFPGNIQNSLQKSGLHFPSSGVGLSLGLLFPIGCPRYRRGLPLETIPFGFSRWLRKCLDFGCPHRNRPFRPIGPGHQQLVGQPVISFQSRQGP